jgi:hypothetical protein
MIIIGGKMLKRNGTLVFTIVMILLAVLVFLTAASPWKARLRVINQTGNEIYLVLYDETGLIAYNLKIQGVPPPPPTPTPGDQPTPTPTGTPDPTATPFNRENFILENTTMFTLERKVYTAVLVACGVVMDGTLDLTTNVKLNLRPCEQMVQLGRRNGEPTMEKPHFFQPPTGGTWRFRYALPEVDMETFPNLPNVIPMK